MGPSKPRSTVLTRRRSVPLFERVEDNFLFLLRNPDAAVGNDEMQHHSRFVARFNADGTPDTTFATGGFKVVAPQLGTVSLSLYGMGVALLADGSITCCSANENSDLFFGFPNSYGTLGYALRLKVRLIPAAPYVHLSHTRFPDPRRYFDAVGVAASGATQAMAHPLSDPSRRCSRPRAASAGRPR